MTKYRIKEFQFYNRTSYEVQRKSIFGFWYNYENKDAETTGWYGSLDKAKESIASKLHNTKVKIVWECDGDVFPTTRPTQ